MIWMILIVAGVVGILGAWISRALMGFPWLSALPPVESLVNWWGGNFGIIIPASAAVVAFAAVPGTLLHRIIASVVGFFGILFLFVVVPMP